MSLWKIGKGRKKEKELTRKKEKEHSRKKRDGIRTTELNRRDQVTAAKSWPSFHRKTGAEVDYQVAAPTELGTPTMHRATIAQPRVRMEGWRQGRLSSRAGTHREEEKNKNILTRKKEKHTLDLSPILRQRVKRQCSANGGRHGVVSKEVHAGVQVGGVGAH